MSAFYSLASQGASVYTHRMKISLRCGVLLLSVFAFSSATIAPSAFAEQAIPAPIKQPATPPVAPPEKAPVIPPARTPTAEELADKTPEAQKPWLYKNSNIPIDRAWTFGTLRNGLRYAVRHNGVPPGQVAIRIRIDAGSLMEQDSEQGFAHLLEHMTFRGSKYVPDGEVIKIWQRFGATFGSDSNAETTPTQTVYKLDLPNASRAGLDESVKILSGMIREPALTDAALKTEVPVVLAEQRERAGAQARVGDATRELFFKGQRLAVRSPIGEPETLRAANSKTVRGFHDRWYRPENTVIVISGDGDPAVFAQLLETYFADWSVAGKSVPAPDFGDPRADGKSGKTVGTQYLAEPSFPYVVNYAVLRPWRQKNDTIAYNQGIFADLLAMQMINRRLEARARSGGSFLQASVNQDDVSRSADGTFVSVIPIGDDWQAALQDVRSVIADATTTAPTKEEIAREVSEFDSALLVSVETADTEAGAKQADDIVNAVDIRETVATPQAALDLFRASKSLFTPDRLLRSTRDLFTGTATRALLVGPQPIKNGTSKLAAAFARPVKASTDARIQAGSVSFDDVPKLGTPGKVTGTEDLGLLGIEVVTLSNGVRAMLYANDAEVSKIMVKVRFGNGYKAFSPDQGLQLWAGQAALVSSGVGDLDQEKLDRLTTGRKIGFNFNVADDAFEFSADTKPEDLTDQLHLFAAKLAEPRWDAAPVARAIAGAKLSYPSYSMAPQTVLDRDLAWLTHDRDNRWKTPTPDELNALTPQNFRATWEPILKSGPIEVMLFGDFKRADAIAALEKTFGALPPRSAAPEATNAENVNFPAGEKPEILRHNGDANQAAAFIAWRTGGGLADIRESRQLEILTSVFNNRLFDQLRAQAGASYSPQVTNNWPVDFPRGGYIAALGQLEPQTIPQFYDIAEGIAADLAAKPVEADELKRITEPLRQVIERSSTGNAFWLWQLEDGSYDRAKVAALRTIYSDYTVTTPARLQALAQKYFAGKPGWKLMILPKDTKVPELAKPEPVTKK